MSTCNSHTHRKQNIPEISKNLMGFFDCMQREYTEWRLLRKVERENKNVSLQAKEADDFKSKN